MKRYNVICADPAWHFQNYSRSTHADAESLWTGAQKHYETLSLDGIVALRPPVAEDAVLFLWCVWPLLPEALMLINKWDFVYKTQAFTWVKQNPSGFGFHMGNGYYTRANTEPVLLATRGKGLTVADHGVRSLVISPRTDHSRKPDEVYHRIERLYPDATRLEMYARRPREGWDVFGNEVENSITLGDVP